MKGLIGFFDILGYQNFLKNNSAEESIEKVLKILTETPKSTNALLESVLNKHIFDKELRKRILEQKESLNYIVFSDTIVYTLQYPENEDDQWITSAKIIMEGCSAALVAKMHTQGLPLRGVIHEGEFFSKEMCLAGRGIIEAYQLCESLDFSGIVYSKTLSEKLLKTCNKNAINNDSLRSFTYLTPKKDGSETKLIHINWLHYAGDYHTSKCKNNIESYVMESFWDHQKDCPNSVDIKIQNTVKVLRKMLHNIHTHKPNTKINSDNS